MAEYNITTTEGVKINSNAATTNNAGEDLLVGERSDSASVNRTLIKFDLSSIPSTYRVTSARLYLYLNYDLASNDRNHRVYRMKVPWNYNQCTWTIRSTGNNWVDLGAFNSADCEQSDIGVRLMDKAESNGWKYWTLDNAAIQQMIRGAFSNNGFLLKADTETNDGWRYDDAGANRPYLLINAVPAMKRVIMC